MSKLIYILIFKIFIFGASLDNTEVLDVNQSKYNPIVLLNSKQYNKILDEAIEKKTDE